MHDLSPPFVDVPPVETIPFPQAARQSRFSVPARGVRAIVGKMIETVMVLVPPAPITCRASPLFPTSACVHQGSEGVVACPSLDVAGHHSRWGSRGRENQHTRTDRTERSPGRRVGGGVYLSIGESKPAIWLLPALILIATLMAVHSLAKRPPGGTA